MFTIIGVDFIKFDLLFPNLLTFIGADFVEVGSLSLDLFIFVKANLVEFSWVYSGLLRFTNANFVDFDLALLNLFTFVEANFDQSRSSSMAITIFSSFISISFIASTAAVELARHTCFPVSSAASYRDLACLVQVSFRKRLVRLSSKTGY